MKKNFRYIILIILFLAGVGFVAVKYNNKQTSDKATVYPFLNRNQHNNIAEWEFAKKNADALIEKLKAKPGDLKSSLALANAYVTEARISGNYAYYDKAAFKTISNVLASAPGNHEALLLKSLLQLSQHHFEEALATAKQAERVNPNNAFVYGLLVDGNIEMGNYQAALEAADKMVTIRPDIRSYSRIAYLREIYGDYPGAIEAMKLAVAAGVPSDEPTEWCRVQLGRLYEQTGQADKATYQYRLSLAARPGYANALHGLARIAVFDNKQDSAIYFLEQATALVTDIDARQNLATVYKNSGQTKKAEKIYHDLIREMDDNEQLMIEDPEAGHYSDKEMAYIHIQLNDFDKALHHALAEYNRRPGNNDVNELMAWVYYKRNEINKAVPHIEKAMQTGSMSPVLLCTAGLIYYKSGDINKARTLLQQSQKNNPVLPVALKNECKVILAQS